MSNEIRREAVIEDLTRQIDALYAKGVANWTIEETRRVNELTKLRAKARAELRDAAERDQLAAAPSPEVQEAEPERLRLIPLTERLPDPDKHPRVVVYTEGYDFAGEQFFDVDAESLNEHRYADPADQPEVCRYATHWIGANDLACLAKAIAHPAPADEAVRRDAERYRLMRIDAAIDAGLFDEEWSDKRHCDPLNFKTEVARIHSDYCMSHGIREHHRTTDAEREAVCGGYYSTMARGG